MKVISSLPPAVRDYVHEFDARVKLLALIRAVGWAMTFFAWWMIGWAIADRFVHFSNGTRLAMLVIALIRIVVILWRPARAWLRHEVDWIDAAGRVERHNPLFGQRLVTVISRVLGAPEHRGSDDMLRELLRDVDRQVRDANPSALLPAGRALRSWIGVLLAVIALSVLLRLPGLEFKTLAMRFLAPMADILPVSTTELVVTPGNNDVLPGQPLQIAADVAKLGAGDLVSLFVSEDQGQHWSRTTMEPAEPAARRYAFKLLAVDRDLRYYVTAGDATSRTYVVRVRRPPAVQRFAVQYEYPSHTQRSTLSIINTDGLIEAPIGSRATLIITATEPLQSAVLTIGRDRILMDRVSGGDSRQRKASFIVRRNARYEINLISDREVPGAGSLATMRIRALPDSKPLVRLPQARDNLRLNPRDILPLAFAALDDYGLESLVLRAQINAGEPVQIPIRIEGDARRQEREFPLDLAILPLAVGDVLSLSLTATDRAGQRATSESIEVLISPRSVDVATYQRVAELTAASIAAAALHDQLTAAATALGEAERESAAKSLAYSAALNRANRQLSAASESATTLRQSLFRAIVNSRSTPLCNTVANWIDQAQVFSWLAEDLFRRADAPAGMGTESRAMLSRSVEASKALRDELKIVATGEQASSAAADRENLLASQKRAGAATQPANAALKERLIQTLDRARQDTADAIARIGLNLDAADLEVQLKVRIDAENAAIAYRLPVDFAAASRQWAQLLQHDRTQPLVLDERLSAASQAEAMRFDADLVRARDWHLASRAVARVESRAHVDPTGRTLAVDSFSELADMIAALQREHNLHRMNQPLPAAELAAIRQQADNAREQLLRIAEGSTPGATRPSLEELAIHAGAKTAVRDYAAAAQLDNELAKVIGPEPVRRIQEKVERAQDIDRIGAEQSTLSQLATQPDPEMARRQRDLSDAIARVDGTDASADPNWRERAAGVLLAAQEALAAMPQHIASAEDALSPWREALARAHQAKLEASSLPDPVRQPAALRAAAQAASDAADAGQRFSDCIRPVTPAITTQLEKTLEPFAPETSSACEVLGRDLVPALQRLLDASNSGDLTAFSLAADDARRSIGSAQKELAQAQEALTARDPLVVAKWVSRAAAKSLSQSPPDLNSAQARQRQAMAALSRAWDREIHEAASLRMGALPSMQSIYATGVAHSPTTHPSTAATTQPAPDAARAAAELLAPGLARLREWARLRPRIADDPLLNAPLNESEPPGFEEPLRLYFDTLGKASTPTTQVSAK